MFESDRIEALAVEAVCAEIATRKAAGDFLTSVEAREIAEQVALREKAGYGFTEEEILENVLGMFNPIRNHVVAQHADESWASITDAMRSLRDAIGNDDKSFDDDISSLDGKTPDINLVWRLLSHTIRPRAALRDFGRGIPESQRRATLREIDRISQILVMVAHRELDPA